MLLRECDGRGERRKAAESEKRASAGPPGPLIPVVEWGVECGGPADCRCVFSSQGGACLFERTLTTGRRVGGRVRFF